MKQQPMPMGERKEKKKKLWGTKAFTYYARMCEHHSSLSYDAEFCAAELSVAEYMMSRNMQFPLCLFFPLSKSLEQSPSLGLHSGLTSGNFNVEHNNVPSNVKLVHQSVGIS